MELACILSLPLISTTKPGQEALATMGRLKSSARGSEKEQRPFPPVKVQRNPEGEVSTRAQAELSETSSFGSRRGSPTTRGEYRNPSFPPLLCSLMSQAPRNNLAAIPRGGASPGFRPKCRQVRQCGDLEPQNQKGKPQAAGTYQAASRD